MKKKHSHSCILRGEFCTVPIYDKFGIYHLGCGLEVSGEDAQIEAILTSCHSACAHVRVLQNIKECAKNETWMQIGGGVTAFKTPLHGWGGVGR